MKESGVGGSPSPRQAVDLPGKKIYVPVFQSALDTKRATPSAQVYKVFLHTRNDAKGVAPYVTNNMHPQNPGGLKSRSGGVDANLHKAGSGKVGKGFRA